MTNTREVLEKEFTFPFRLHDYQISAIDEAMALTDLYRGALFRDKVGLGKSAQALGFCLMQSIVGEVEQILALMPPILIDQFTEFVESVGGVGKPLIYGGTPAQRGKMDLTGFPIVIMSYNIFRGDYARISKWASKSKLAILCDELSLKSSNITYKRLKELIYGRLKITPGVDLPKYPFCALNATPVSDREHIYYWSSIFRPDVYWSKKLFDIRHAGNVDHWGNVTAWHDTEFMDESFDSFSVLSKNVEMELPEGVYSEVPYALTPKHKELYDDIEEAEFKMLPDDMIEMAVDAFFSTLQRVVLTPADYGLDVRPPILDFIDGVIDQLDDDDRVMIFTRHVSVSKMLVAAYPKAVAVFGAVKDKQGNISRFKRGEAQIMIANIESLGKGGNFQVANHMIFAELPFRSDVMTQTCGRILRQGQTRRCFFHIPLAIGTIQRRIYRRLLDNDEDLLKFNRNKKTLREFISS